MNNPIQWVEIAAIDLERAKDFYAKVFNLAFQLIEMPDSKMYMFGDGTKMGSSGCLVSSSVNTPSTDGTIIYFKCQDVADEVSRVEEAGGTVIVPKTDIGQFGFFAQIIDSEGNRIGLHNDKPK